jgi:hypothetical protein
VKIIKRFKKGALGVVAAFVLAISALAVGFSATPAFAALNPSAYLDVDGTDLVAGGVATGSVIAGATYDEPSNTLTLNNFTGDYIEAGYMDVNIVLMGNNTLTDSTSGLAILGVWNGGNLTISGSGTLNVNHTGTTGTIYGIQVDGNVSITSGAVNVNLAGATGNFGIDASGFAIYIANGANVTVTIGGSMVSANALVASAINLADGVVIKEGMDAASAVVVPSLTLTAFGTDITTNTQFVSISPGSVSPPPSGDVDDNTNNPATGDINVAFIIATSMVALAGVVFGTVLMKRSRA